MLFSSYELNSKLYTSKADIISETGMRFTDVRPNFVSSISSDDSWKSVRIQTLFNTLSAYFKELAETNTPAVVAYSGGIDSEVLLYSAYRSGVNVTAVTIDLFGINKYDLQYAIAFCKKLGINHEIISVSEKEIKDYYLPRLCLEVETPAYLLLGGYIVADIYDKRQFDGRVIVANMDPCQLVTDNNFTYFTEAEYGFWIKKFNKARNKELVYDPMTNVNVFHAFINNKLFTERIENCPYGMYFFDAKYLGKEYYYQDPDFSELNRRFSQHGWEKIKKSFGYTKEMVPDCNPDLKSEGVPFIKTNAAIQFIEKEINKKHPDYELFAWLQTHGKIDLKFNYNSINTQVFIPTPPLSRNANAFYYKCINHDYYGNITKLQEDK
jgi:hypothetical protein